MNGKHDHDLPHVTTERELITEREAARERLRASVDTLAQQANLHVQMQKDPLKMIGGASAVGAVLGLMMGRQMRRTKKIYVDADSPAKYQKALIKAQKSQKGGGVGGALVATLGTLAVKTLTERVITPRLEQLSTSLLDRAGQAPAAGPRAALDRGQQVTFTEVDRVTGRPATFDKPVTGPVTLTTGEGGQVVVKEGRTPVHSSAATAAFLKEPQGGEDHHPKADAPGLHTSGRPAHASHDRSGTVTAVSPVTPTHPGVVPMPESQVEAKAVGTAIPDTDRRNPTASAALPGGQTPHSTGATGPAVTPRHAGVVSMPDSQVDAKATGTAIDPLHRSNPNAGPVTRPGTGAVGTGPTGPVVTPAHAGVVRMPDSQVEAKASGTPIAGDERGNPNAR